MNPSGYSSLLPPGSSGSGDSCWGLESFPPTFSSSCSKNIVFKICFSTWLLPEKAAPHTLCCSAQWGTGTAPPNSLPCTALHKAAHQGPSPHKPLSWGPRSALDFMLPTWTAKSTCCNAILPEEILIAAISNYQQSDDESWERHWENHRCQNWNWEKRKSYPPAEGLFPATGFSLWQLFREFDMCRDRITEPSNCWNILQSGTGQMWLEQHTDQRISLCPLLVC